MKKVFSCLAFSLFIVCALFSQKRNMTPDDGLKMVRLGSTMISPDGKSVIYGKSTLNWKENKRETKYYHLSAEGKEEYQYIGKDGASSLAYSPKGTFISLKRAVDIHPGYRLETTEPAREKGSSETQTMI